MGIVDTRQSSSQDEMTYREHPSGKNLPPSAPAHVQTAADSNSLTRELPADSGNSAAIPTTHAHAPRKVGLKLAPGARSATPPRVTPAKLAPPPLVPQPSTGPAKPADPKVQPSSAPSEEPTDASREPENTYPKLPAAHDSEADDLPPKLPAASQPEPEEHPAKLPADSKFEPDYPIKPPADFVTVDMDEKDAFLPPPKNVNCTRRSIIVASSVLAVLILALGLGLGLGFALKHKSSHTQSPPALPPTYTPIPTSYAIAPTPISTSSYTPTYTSTAPSTRISTSNYDISCCSVQCPEVTRSTSTAGDRCCGSTIVDRGIYTCITKLALAACSLTC